MLALTLLLLVSPVSAKDITANDNEQSTVLAICDVAAQSPTISREVRLTISNFCVMWQKKVEAANAAPKEKEPEK